MKTEETDKCVTSIQEVDSKRRRVFINYEPAFVLYISEIRRFNIKKDAYISSEDYEGIIDILNKRSKIRAMSLLKDRDYTRKKLFEKLKSFLVKEKRSYRMFVTVQNYEIDFPAFVDSL